MIVRIHSELSTKSNFFANLQESANLKQFDPSETNKANRFTQFATQSIHAGEDPSTSSPPIYQAATVDGVYLRTGNPTIDALETRITALEGGTSAIATSSGTSAISQTLSALLSTGDRIICHQTIYTWTKEILNTYLSKFGVEVVYIDMRNLDQLRESLQKPTKLVYFEPITNPTVDVIDTEAVIQIAKTVEAIVVVDNTYLTPYHLKPFDVGADIVIHSATKYLCGHGDTLAGLIVCRTPKFVEQMAHVRNAFGGVLSPQNAFLILRGMKTLPLRMKQHSANAQRVAEYLENHPKVPQVNYPGLQTHVGHSVAKQMTKNGFGGMINFGLTSPTAQVRFLNRVQLCKPWVSLGDTQSLVVAGNLGGLLTGGHDRIRMSVGLESTDDIIADLNFALI